MKIRIFVLFYGDYFNLHERIINSLDAATREKPDVAFSLWGNVLTPPSVELLSRFRESQGSARVSCRFSTQNTHKYKAMRQMFASDIAADDEWIVWFDDDSWINHPSDWLDRTEQYIRSCARENICCLGRKLSLHWEHGEVKFSQTASWHRGLKPEIILNKNRRNIGVHFIWGAYWWLRADMVRLLDWPDVRLNHNGGDVQLGEALRQHGLKVHDFHYGVRVCDAARRGFSEPRARLP